MSHSGPSMLNSADTNGILPAPFKGPNATNTASRTVTSDKSVLHLEWKNLDDFVKWKLEEEKKLSINLVSGLTHQTAHAYVQQHGSILYICRPIVAESGKISCPSYLLVQLPSDRGAVIAVYNEKHLHGQDGARKSLKGTVVAKNKGKKPISNGPTAEMPDQAGDISACAPPKAAHPSLKPNTLSEHSSSAVPSTDGALDWGDDAALCDKYAHDIVNLIARLEFKKRKDVGVQTENVTGGDGLPSLNVPQHNWNLYGRATTTNGHGGAGDLAPGLYPNLTKNQDAAPGPQPLGNHNSQSVVSPTTAVDKHNLPSEDEPENSVSTVSEGRKRKNTDTNDNLDNDVQDSDKRPRSGWGSGGESFAFYGAMPESSSSQKETSALAFDVATEAKWFTPAPDAVSGGQPIENWDTWWPDDVLAWGEADWEKAFNAAHKDGLLSNNMFVEHALPGELTTGNQGGVGADQDPFPSVPRKKQLWNGSDEPALLPFSGFDESAYSNFFSGFK